MISEMARLRCGRSVSLLALAIAVSAGHAHDEDWRKLVDKIGAVEGPMLRDWLLLRPGLPALAGRVLARWWRGTGAGL